jgi:Peptidase M50B-like
MRPAEQRAVSAIKTELSRVIRYDDESIVADVWLWQRYDCGCYPSLAPARRRAVETAWHEAGHAVAALAVGARFSSASIHHSCGTDGRVHGITGEASHAFVIDAAGQIAERLRTWTMLERDADLLAWLPTWARDGGDARRFRRGVRDRLDGDERAAWRQAEKLLTPRRLQIREVARALLVHPRHLRYAVVAALVHNGGRKGDK